MIRRVWSNSATFEEITFQAGFNIIVAERDEAATDQHSRNARGKTSVLQAINYCLGSELPTNFRSLVDTGWSFSVELDMFGGTVRATRDLRRRTRIRLESDDIDFVSAPLWSEIWNEDTGDIHLSDWKYLLGLSLFGLDEAQQARGLSPRTLLSYVLRLSPPNDPLKVVAQQSAWSSRQHIAYLLGLDWRFTRDLVALDREEETYKALRVATDEGIAPQVIRSESDLMIERNEAASVVGDLDAQLNAFVIIDRHEDVVSELDRVRTDILTLSDESVADSRLITLYSSSIARATDLQGDTESELANVTLLYEELGRAFSARALRRLGEVQQFHRTLRENRSAFIQADLEELLRRERDRQARIGELAARRDRLQLLLDQGGGLDELLRLRSDRGAAQARLDQAERALAGVREMAAAQAELGVRRAEFRRAARQELEADRTYLDRVAGRFDEMMQLLYNQNGVLTVEVDRTGYRFQIYVPNSTSGGVAHMRLFCFDLTLLSESAPTHHPQFLIHDSPVFDGVDPRQRESALRMAHDIVDSTGKQYIVTLNSNDVPEALLEEDWYTTSVRRTIYDTEIGGAMGVIF